MWMISDIINGLYYVILIRFYR